MNPYTPAQLTELNSQLATLPLADALRYLRSKIDGRIAFSTSFGLEDQVLTDAIFRHTLDIDVFSLDTGRQFPETYDTWAATVAHYQQPIRALYPDPYALEHYVNERGINAFYQSVEARKACCAIRKLEPLQRALAGATVWMTGLRAAQSSFRADMQRLAWDPQHQLLKFNPLFEWSRRELWAYLRAYSVPYNPLHEQHMPSIGCAPCTRAITAGEDERAGRWWWESHNQECGLHDGTRPVQWHSTQTLSQVRAAS